MGRGPAPPRRRRARAVPKRDRRRRIHLVGRRVRHVRHLRQRADPSRPRFVTLDGAEFELPASVLGERAGRAAGRCRRRATPSRPQRTCSKQELAGSPTASPHVTPAADRRHVRGRSRRPPAVRTGTPPRRERDADPIRRARGDMDHGAALVPDALARRHPAAPATRRRARGDAVRRASSTGRSRPWLLLPAGGPRGPRRAERHGSVGHRCPGS